MKTLICIDRDGTLIYDSKDHLHIGSTEDWKEKIEILPNAVEGLKILNELADARVYMITNQSGISIKELPLLTKKRADEVCQEVLDIFEELEAPLTGFFACPHADEEYVKSHPQYTFEEPLICDCECIKPKLGMVFDALMEEGLDLKDVDVYVIGDRASDVKTGVNANGIGVLVPWKNESGEDKKVKEMNSERTFIAKDFLDAAEFIVKRENI